MHVCCMSDYGPGGGGGDMVNGCVPSGKVKRG